MPCISGPSYSEETKRQEQNTISKDLLCSACRSLERLGYDFDENPALSNWWHKHKLEDEKKRLKQEAAERVKEFERNRLENILTKPVTELTDEEYQILKKHMRSS